MNYNNIRGFLKSLSYEIDGLVTKIGVLKLVLLMGLFILLNYLIDTYFHDFLFKFYMLILMVVAFFIISLESDSKIKYLGIWIGSIIGVIFTITMVLMLVYGIGEPLIETIYGCLINCWFHEIQQIN